MEKTLSTPPANSSGNPDSQVENRKLENPVVPALPAVNTKAAPALFGGHKGGKKTLSGHPVGSPEHLVWKREQDRLRKARLAASAMAAEVLPPLPSPNAANVATNPPSSNPSGTLAIPISGLPDSADGVVFPAVAGVGFIPWTQRMLQKPAALILRIVDRLRKRQLFGLLDKMALPPETAKEFKKDFDWNEKAAADFADGLAEVAALQLNKNQVSSEHSVYVNVLLSGGELVASHIAVLDRLQKIVLEKMKMDSQPSGSRNNGERSA